jgi:hypothetical protein
VDSGELWREYNKPGGKRAGAELGRSSKFIPQNLDTFRQRARVERGPALGNVLRAAEEAWIAAGFPDDTGALDAILQDAIRQIAS